MKPSILLLTLLAIIVTIVAMGYLTIRIIKKSSNPKKYSLLCSNTASTTLYFRAFSHGVADFTICRKFAWKFLSNEEAIRVKKLITDEIKMYIETVERN